MLQHMLVSRGLERYEIVRICSLSFRVRGIVRSRDVRVAVLIAPLLVE